MIQLEDYFKAYPELREQWEYPAKSLLARENLLIAEALLDGVRFMVNPFTGTHIAGSANGGIRPANSGVGAKFTNHARARAVDVYDHFRDYAAWCMARIDRLQAQGLYMEDPRWTVSEHGNHWVHHQDIPPQSGKIIYIPSAAPPLGPWPDPWVGKRVETIKESP